jgi:hypothetical protein
MTEDEYLWRWMKSLDGPISAAARRMIESDESEGHVHVAKGEPRTREMVERDHLSSAVMRMAGQYTAAEIGQILGKPDYTIRNIIKKASRNDAA